MITRDEMLAEYRFEFLSAMEDEGLTADDRMRFVQSVIDDLERSYPDFADDPDFLWLHRDMTNYVSGYVFTPNTLL